MQKKKLSAEDRLDIQELFGRYTWALDTGDAEGVLACFTEDGVIEHPPQGLCSGREGILALLDELWHARGNWFRGRQHFAGNFVITPDAEGARARAFWAILQHNLDYHNTFVFALGNWDNTCVKQGDEWLFKALRVTPWVSDERIPWHSKKPELPPFG